LHRARRRCRAPRGGHLHANGQRADDRAVRRARPADGGGTGGGAPGDRPDPGGRSPRGPRSRCPNAHRGGRDGDNPSGDRSRPVRLRPRGDAPDVARARSGRAGPGGSRGDDQRRARRDPDHAAGAGRRHRVRSADPRGGPATLRVRTCAGLRDRHPRWSRVRGARDAVTCRAVSRKSHQRRLARQAARRQAERRRRRRQRATVIGVSIAVALGGIGLAVYAFTRGGSGATASGTPTPSATGSTPASVDPSPGPKAVACGARAPKNATTPKPQFATPPTMSLKAGATYLATLRTSCGTIVIRLDQKSAPNTVNSFVFLARKGFFDGK